MKNVFFILTTALFFVTEVQAAPCRSVAVNPQIRISTSYGKLRYNFIKNQDEITALAKENNRLEQGFFASGLSLIKVVYDVNLTSTIQPEKSNLCVVPVIIDLYIGYQNPIIYVDKSLPKDSCKYNLVLRHEQTHQQINKATLEYFLPMFYDAIQKIAKSTPAVSVASEADMHNGTQVLLNKYVKKMAPLVEVFKKELAIEQGKLDNKINYGIEEKLCR